MIVCNYVDECLREVESKFLKSLRELQVFNGSGSVSVEADEHVSPLIDIVEQLSKLNNINGAAHVLVEHADHHLAGLLAELGHVAVDEGGLELQSTDLTTAISVH